ncbi:MAG: hypothetical protein LCH36_05980 [Actinobacteria bacterium]|jgi:hypothetical protein|nr:hypothetical protein [Actinomycetota bacterium]
MSVPVLVGVAAAALAIALPVVAAAAELDASARAAGAADAAALAAADAALGWVNSEPCDIAESVANAVGADLVGCEANLETGQVRISVSVQTMFRRVTARAHAAPSVA